MSLWSLASSISTEAVRRKEEKGISVAIFERVMGEGITVGSWGKKQFGDNGQVSWKIIVVGQEEPAFIVRVV